MNFTISHTYESLNFVARQTTCFYCSCSRSKAGPSVNRPSCHSPIHSRETPKLWGYGEIGKAQRSLESNWQPPDSKSFFRVLPPPLLKFAHILGEGVAGFWKVCHDLYFHFTLYLSCASLSETFVVMQRFDTFANFWQTLAFIQSEGICHHWELGANSHLHWTWFSNLLDANMMTDFTIEKTEKMRTAAKDHEDRKSTAAANRISLVAPGWSSFLQRTSPFLKQIDRA